LEVVKRGLLFWKGNESRRAAKLCPPEIRDARRRHCERSEAIQNEASASSAVMGGKMGVARFWIASLRSQ
jgi:hypothetical protein